MISPYQFWGELHYELKKQQHDERFLIQAIHDHFKSIPVDQLKIEENSLLFSTYTSLFSLEHKVKIQLKKGEDPSIFYLFNYGELYKIILMVLLFALFFIKFSWWIYLVIAVSFSVALVTANVYYVNSFIKRNIIAAAKTHAYIDEDFISRKQQEWIKNPLKCPACGEEINQYSTRCLNCGIKVSGRKFESKTNTTSKQYTIKYDIKKDDKKNRR